MSKDKDFPLVHKDDRARWQARLIAKRLNNVGWPLAVLLVEFKRSVHDRARTIDPENEHDWHSLTLGWALAKRLKPRLAWDFASFVRYHTSMA